MSSLSRLNYLAKIKADFLCRFRELEWNDNTNTHSKKSNDKHQ